jgi:choline dehydrogenase-like flavoprotein
MEHPERTAAYLAITSRVVLEDRMLRRSRAMLCLSEEAQRTHELLNANIDLGAMGTLRESPAGGVPLAIRDTLNRVDSLGSGEPANEDPSRSQAYTRCFIRAEASPRRESRVTLEDRETDALGLRRPRLTFVMDTLESRTFVRTMEIVARELGARQGGRVMLRLAEEAVNIPIAGPLWGGVGGGNHHMGTTRMSDHPAGGVVDRHCLVHGVSNLYVAGSSVFPTGGMANPTFTIVALALRMAGHIAARLGGS